MPMALQLHTFSFGAIQLPAAAAGGSPSHAAFRFTSVGGPFCIVGFFVTPVPAPAGSPGGHVTIALGRINGSGVIHPEIQIAEGIGVAPQDLVVSYGSVLSSSSSLSFHVSQTPSAAGSGTAYRLEGTVTFFADEGVTLAVTAEAP
jgi:hypothetical protein